MTLQRLRRLAAAILTLVVPTFGAVLFTPAVSADEPKPGATADAKPVKVVVSLVGGGGDEDLKAFRKALGEVSGLKFKAEDVRSSDIRREEMLFTKPFSLELAEISKTDVGTVAKAIASAETPSKDRVSPSMYLVIAYLPGGTDNEQLREILGGVKGVDAKESWVGDINLWVKLDKSGQGKFADIIKALKDGGVAIKDQP
jgi:hypothetical protein